MSDEVYDSQVLENDDDMSDTEIRMNPSFYIHRGIIKAQDVLLMPNMTDALLRYRLIADSLKMIAFSSRITTQSALDEKSQKFREELKEQGDIRLFKIANKEMEIILEEVFKSKMMTDPAKL